MDITKLNCPFDTIDAIVHIADIHIRNLRRHTEYTEQFEKLYTEIQGILNTTPNTIICVAGDIVHSKVEMSPELINMTSLFFKRLSDLTFTIVTPGNHDANLNNEYRMDALSPIISNSERSNLLYLKDSGLYDIGGLVFNNMSPLQSKTSYIRIGDELKDRYVVGIYHGPVNNSVTDTGISFKNNFGIDIFDGCDIVLLGDIHVKQQLQSYHISTTGTKKPSILYCGSLIQQNFGESDHNHGLVIWDIKSRKFRFIELDNNHFFYTINVNNDEDVVLHPKINAHTRIRIKCNNCSKEYLDLLLNRLRQDYGITDISVLNIGSNLVKFGGDNSQNLEELYIRNVGDQNKAIVQYISEYRKDLPGDISNKITEYNIVLNNKLQGSKDLLRNKFWIPKKFEFSNMCCYGEDNEIIFDGLKGILGIFAGNASGKSSIVEALCFCLFDRSPRTYKADKILNTAKDYFHCKFTFELDGEEYFIEKVGTKYNKPNTPTRCRVDINFWKIDKETGNRVTLNGDERYDTRSIINEYIGSYEDFINTNLSFQGSVSNFVESTQTERKDMLSKFLDLSIFDSLYKEANQQKNAADLEIQTINNSKLNSLDLLENTKKTNNKELATLNSKLETAEALLESKNLEILQLSRNIQEIRVYDLPTLLENQALTSSSISLLETENIQLNTRLSAIQLDKLEIENKKNAIDSNLVTTKLSELAIKKIERGSITDSINILSEKIKYMDATVKKLHNHEYDPLCKYCMTNPFLIEALTISGSINVRRDELNERKTDLALVTDTITSLSSYEVIQSSLETYIADLHDIHNEVKSITTKLDGNKKLIIEKEKILKTIEYEILEYYRTQNQVDKNTKLEDKILNLTSEVNALKEEIRLDNIKKVSLSTSIELLILEIKQTKEQLERKSKLYKESVLIETYLQIVDRDGLPYFLISRYLPILEKEIDNVLSNLVDFKIILDMDGKNINSYIVYGDNKFWPLELSSGMEKFISSIAIRIALHNISMLPKTNFFIIDEGMGVLDSSNLNSIYLLFNYMREKFKFVFVISHLDGIKDMVDDSYTLSTKDGFSKLIMV